MHLNIVVCTLNTIALYWFLVEFLDLGYKYKLWKKIKITKIVKPFDCPFCMAFWCGVIVIIGNLLIPDILNGLLLLSLPLSIAFLINKIK